MRWSTDGSADPGLIVHELGHNYTMGMLANNEWREALPEFVGAIQSRFAAMTRSIPAGQARAREGAPTALSVQLSGGMASVSRAATSWMMAYPWRSSSTSDNRM